MGLFDMFARKGPGAIRKHGARVANKRAQNPDRWESIQTLAEIGTEDAVRALLPRFTIRVDPSIVDQQEKDAALQGIVAAGDAAVAPVCEFLRTTESVAWPLKILDQLLPPDRVVEELLRVLDTFDTEYERDPQRKIQVISYIEDHRDPRITPAVKPFLDDMNEEVRLHAAGAVLGQEDADTCVDALVAAILREESVRVRSRMLDGFVDNQWPLPEAQRDDVRKRLPDGYALDAEGLVRKK